ncbi:MAG: alkaline phosphatase family protein [Planctomycetia bacterium]|nr:alkaline phosphatase family protein [Planctomycetia bacterium]
MKALIGLVLMLASIHACAVAQNNTGKTENVIVITWDGFRWQEMFSGADEVLMDKQNGGVKDIPGLKNQFWREKAQERREALLPFVWGTMAKQGQLFGDPSSKAHCKSTNGLKFSYPGYSELFCGVADQRIDSNDKRENPNLSVLEYLNQQPGLKNRVAAFCTWDVFPSIFRSHKNGLFVHAGWQPRLDKNLSDKQRHLNEFMDRLPRYWPDNVFDFVTMESAFDYLQQHKPRVMYIGLGETDEWGHGRRYDLYLNSAHQADKFLAELWAKLQQMPQYQNKTSIILTTDHGRGMTRINWTDHGEKVEGAEFIWIGVLGPDTPALGLRKEVATTQSQVAATVSALLGLNFQSASPQAAAPLPIFQAN